MDIRNTESIATAGSLSDRAFAVNPEVENISLLFDDDKLKLVDTNLAVNKLPFQLYSKAVKKVFLTYNGVSETTDNLLETVVLESGNTMSSEQEPGGPNTNEWHYSPRNFRIPDEIQYLSNPSDTYNWPYDQSQGVTVIKKFLGGESGLRHEPYTAFYRTPAQHSFELANAINNSIYTDGWYTSYVIVAKTWAAAKAATSANKGQIVYHDGEFYINNTGETGALVADTNDPLKFIPDPGNWSSNPNFLEWKDLMRKNMGISNKNSQIYFTEHQHLVLVDLNKAINIEVVRMSNNCFKPEFNASKVSTWMKLTQKRLSAFVKFKGEIFKSAQIIIESTRQSCNQCLYNTNVY